MTPILNCNLVKFKFYQRSSIRWRIVAGPGNYGSVIFSLYFRSIMFALHIGEYKWNTNGTPDVCVQAPEGCVAHWVWISLSKLIDRTFPHFLQVSHMIEIFFIYIFKWKQQRIRIYNILLYYYYVQFRIYVLCRICVVDSTDFDQGNQSWSKLYRKVVKGWIGRVNYNKCISFGSFPFLHIIFYFK